MEKIMKLAKIFNVCLIIMQVANIIVMVLLSAMFIFNSLLFKGGGSTLPSVSCTLGGIKLLFADFLPQKGNYVIEVLIPFLICVINIVLILFGISLFKKIIKPMREGTSPFVAGISKYINQLGIVVLSGYILKVVADYFTNLQTADTLRKVFPKTLITDITTRPDINISPIAIILLVFLIASIFKYGEKLQQESDETL